MSHFNASSTGAQVVAAFPDKVQGKTFVITGASTNSLGSQTAIFLASGHPAKLILLGRTESKITPIIDSIRAMSPSTDAQFIPLDLASFGSIREAAATILASVEKIDVLINNAGIMGIAEYTLTAEGIESQFGVNHIGHFLLTNLLVPKIMGRVVNLSSSGHMLGEVRFEDWNFGGGKTYDPWAAYGQSKTANILFAVSLAKKLASKRVLAFSVHPGTIVTTNLGTHVPPAEWTDVVAPMFVKRGFPNPFEGNPFRTLETGTTSTLVATLDPSLKRNSGAYIANATIGKAAEYAVDVENAERLWALSENIVGEKF